MCQIPFIFVYNFAKHVRKVFFIKLLLTAGWEMVKARWAYCVQVIYKVREEKVIKWP